MVPTVKCQVTTMTSVTRSFKFIPAFRNFFTGCGHCKKAKPEFTKAAENFKDDPKIEFVAVDCTSHQSLCSAHEVTGYPTIKYFNYLIKNVKSYNAGRTVRAHTECSVFHYRVVGYGFHKLHKGTRRYRLHSN